MDKQYEEIELVAGASIERAVGTLHRYKEKGQLACIKFNGATLYSDTVTIDSAYEDITGKTKDEFYAEREARMDEYKREEQAHKERIPELSKLWMEKGREVLTTDKWAFWDEIVPIRLKDLYRGMELKSCLDIVEILNTDGTLEEAKEMIESQNHSGMSFGLVCAMVKEFCERGSEFVDYVNAKG